MRRNIRIIILIALAIMLFCGCNANDNSTLTNNVVEENQNAKEGQITSKDDGTTTPESNNDKGDKSQEYDHSLVCDRWIDSGKINVDSEIDISIELEYDYRIPQIVADTEDAKAINNQLADMYEGMHNEIQKAKEAGSISSEYFENANAELYITDYDCYWNDSIVSIVIYHTIFSDFVSSYTVYNYDFETGKQLKNTDLLGKYGISMEEYLEDIRRAALYAFDRQFKEFYESEVPLVSSDRKVDDLYDGNKALASDYIFEIEDPDERVLFSNGTYLNYRAKTIHEKNINENIQVFINENGELKAFVTIYDNIQFGYHIEILSPIQKNNYGFSVNRNNEVYVESKADGIYVTIQDTEWMRRIFGDSSLEYGKEYKINGTYKNYCDAYVSMVGNGLNPYVVLISDDGFMAYVDTVSGANTNYFSIVEPVLGLVDLKSFEKEIESQLIFAINGKNQLVDVDSELYIDAEITYEELEQYLLKLDYITGYFAIVTNDEGLKVEVSIENNENGRPKFAVRSHSTEEEFAISQDSYIFYNGMNEKGIVYYYYYTREGEDSLYGVMAIDTNYSIEEAVYTYLGGYDLFESKGKEVVLNQCVE